MNTHTGFADTAFDSDSYQNYRPTYGKALFDQLLKYHDGPRNCAIDIGCGTGQITNVLANYFDTVHGFDSSQKMLEKASSKGKIQYEVAQAESLPSLADSSVDLITVGQAAHWFDLPVWFAEMSRILRPMGTLSFWSYNEAVFTDSKSATAIWNKYSHDPQGLGPCWPQPGRSILESAMDGVDPPLSLFRDVERHYTMQRGSSTPSPVSCTFPLSSAEKYFRTSSAFHKWQGRPDNKNGKSRAEGGDGDVIDDAMDEIKRDTKWTDETIVNVHWPTIAVLARKK